MRVLVFISLFLLGSNLTQGSEADSLMAVYANKSNPDTLRINAAIDASKLYLEATHDSAFYFANKAWVLLNNYPESYYKTKSQANLFYVLGSVYINRSDSKQGLRFLFYSHALFAKIKHLIGSAYLLNNIGLVYNDRADYSKAISFYLRSLKIKEVLGNPYSIALAHLNLGLIYYSIQDYDKALEYYGQAQKIFEKESNKLPLTVLLYNMGLVFYDTKNYTKAIDYEEKSLQLGIELNDPESQAKACSNLGSIYAALGEYTKAKSYADRSLKLLTELGDLRSQAGSKALLAEIELKQNNYANAIRIGNEALNAATEVEDLNLCKDLHQYLYRANKKTQNEKLALYHLEAYSNLVDSIFRSDKQKQIVRQALNYEFKKKEESIRLEQEKKDIESKARTRVQRIVIYTAIAILLIVVVFSISLYRRFTLTRLQKSIIEEQKKLVEQKNQEVISSITYAQKIQNALLAPQKLLNQELIQSGIAKEFFLYFKPKDIVSGDFYWAMHHGDNFYLAICDSTGHGVPGAFMSLLNSNYLREAIIEKGISAPNLIFDYVRERLVKGFEGESQKDGMDAILLRFDSNKKQIGFASANNRSILVRNQEIIKLGSDKMPVGKGEITAQFQHFELQLQANDMLYLFTDGYADQFGGPSGKKFMYKTLNQFLVEQSLKSCEVQQQALAEKMKQWRGELEQVDDITLMGIRF